MSRPRDCRRSSTAPTVDHPEFHDIRISAKVAGAKSDFIRYTIMNGTTPGSWTTIPAASIQKAITISGLTPATIYRVSGASSGRARLLGLEFDRNSHVPLDRSSLKGI